MPRFEVTFAQFGGTREAQPAPLHCIPTPLSQEQSQECLLRGVPDVSGDAVIPVPEKLVLLVKLPLVLPNGHSESLLLKVRLLLFPHSCFF